MPEWGSGRARLTALPIVMSSFAPGAAATKWANARERLSTATAAAPPGCRPSHSSRASCGSTDSDHSFPVSRASPTASGARPKARASWWEAARSQTSVRRPRAAVARPRAAATVVFPAPPLPVTYSSALPSSASTSAGSTVGASGTGSRWTAAFRRAWAVVIRTLRGR